MWGKVESFADLFTQKSWKKLQPAAEETTGSERQWAPLWTDKATHEEAETLSGHMSCQQPPVEQVVEAREQRQEKPLCHQVLTCDSGFLRWIPHV